jgi:alpha-tubulin suppressor-like RCC1 family protein
MSGINETGKVYDRQLALILCLATRSSPLEAVQAVLSSDGFSKEINSIGPLGSSALHVAAWRNHHELVRSILDTASVDINLRDEESGWNALHRALYYGNVRIASLLLAAGASSHEVDFMGRKPVDLLSSRLTKAIHEASTVGNDKVYSYVVGHRHVFSWGNGSNYTLGTGSLEVELAPSRVDSLHMHDIVEIAAAKFHSAAVTVDGKLFTWGWGRGGRLGQPDSHIHSGSGAVIQPRLVASLFHCDKRVKRISIAKHHTLLTTTEGELYSMGGNRFGQLGHGNGVGASVAEPMKVTALKSHCVTNISAANKHSVAVTSSGDVFTWGSNAAGQLGYGAFDLMSSPSPRIVEAMKGKVVVECAAAKRHTVVLTTEGDVLTWGHRGVSPRKVNLSSVRKSTMLNGAPLRFQKGYKDVSKPKVQQICAGAAHTSVLTTTGIVLSWRSADPQCQIQEIGGLLAGKRVISISSGKYRTAAVTDTGSVYMWEGRADYNPAECHLSSDGSKKKKKSFKNSGIDSNSRGMQMLGSSMDSLSSHDGGSHLGSSPGSFSYKYGSPSMTDRMHSRLSKAIYNPDNGRNSGCGGYGLSTSPFPSSSIANPSSPMPTRNVNGRNDFGGNIAEIEPFHKIYPEVVEGLCRISQVAVGEKHSVALQSWSRSGEMYQNIGEGNSIEACPYTMGPSSLQVQCEETIARSMVDPYTVLQVMLYAEAAGADMLYKRCCSVAALNLDIVITEHPHIFSDMPLNLLQDIENELEQWMARSSILSRSKENRFDEIVSLTPTCKKNLGMKWPSRAERDLGDALVEHETLVPEGFGLSFATDASLEADACIRKEGGGNHSNEINNTREDILRRIQQIHSIEAKVKAGATLDTQQKTKLMQKGVMLSALAALEGGVPYKEVDILMKSASKVVVESQGQRSSTSCKLRVGDNSNQCHPKEANAKQKPSLSTKSRRKSRKHRTSRAEEIHMTCDPDDSANHLRQMRLSDGGMGTDVAAIRSPRIVGFDPVPAPAESKIDFDDLPASLDAGPSNRQPMKDGPLNVAPVTTVGFQTQTTSGNPSPNQNHSEPKTRKGGLTMFLRGELDIDPPKTTPWGPKRMETPVSPLSKWFQERERPPSRPESQNTALNKSSTPTSTSGKQPKKQLGIKISLKDYLMGGRVSGTNAALDTSSPAAWSAKQESISHHEKEPVKSLRTIQSEQEELSAAQRRNIHSKPVSSYSKVLEINGPNSMHSNSLGQSPVGTRIMYGSSPQSAMRTFIPSLGPAESRWYISEELAIAAARAKPLKDIQEEERAAKEVAEIEAAFQSLERRQHEEAKKGREPRRRKPRKK